jgi:ribosome-associated translation inhibitor RaiA
MNMISPQITFRDMPPSEAVSARIVERTAQLAKFHPRITSCRVVVRAPHRHSTKGRLYSIRIDLKVPRRDIVINRTPTPRQAHQDIYVAVRDAFDALDRRLEDTARRQRGDIKAHSKGKPRKPPF